MEKVSRTTHLPDGVRVRTLFGTMMRREHPQDRPAVSPLMGVYRFREMVGGFPAWYSIDARGDFADFIVVTPSQSEAGVVATLARGIFGPDLNVPRLRVIVGRPGASASQAWLPGFVPLRPAAPLEQSPGPSASDPS